jgi:hypothetical protein
MQALDHPVFAAGPLVRAFVMRCCDRFSLQPRHGRPLFRRTPVYGVGRKVWEFCRVLRLRAANRESARISTIE